MPIDTILFDLDGTLLPMDQDVFTRGYFKLLAQQVAPRGYEPTQLVNAIWTGTAAMVANDGSCLNETAFWNKFATCYDHDVLQDKPLFNEFYAQEFQQARTFCGFNPAAAETVHLLKARGYRIILATNPIFPAVATESRIRWAGLAPEDFEHYTTYENCHFCKPNPRYYAEIAEQCGLTPETCLMVGNDVTEDLAAEKIGMQTYLLTDCLINRDSKDVSAYPQGSFADLAAYLPSIK